MPLKWKWTQPFLDRGHTGTLFWSSFDGFCYPSWRLTNFGRAVLVMSGNADDKAWQSSGTDHPELLLQVHGFIQIQTPLSVILSFYSGNKMSHHLSIRRVTVILIALQDSYLPQLLHDGGGLQEHQLFCKQMTALPPCLLVSFLFSQECQLTLKCRGITPADATILHA